MDVRKRQTFANKERLGLEDLLEGVECPLETAEIVEMYLSWERRV